MVNAKARQLYDAEKISVNTAWLKKGGEHFEVVIDPDKALEYRRTKGQSPDIRECLHSERVFADAKRGLHASDAQLQQLFSTTDPLVIAKTLILQGDLQLTEDHRRAIREAKRNSLITRICTYAIDPKTGLPHPRTRIELAMDEAKVKIDDNRDVEEQVPEIVRKLQPILPLRLEVITLQVHLPAPYGQKLYGELGRFGKLKRTEWMADGGLLAQVEMPAGLQTDLFDEMGKRTHGAAHIKKVDERREYTQ